MKKVLKILKPVKFLSCSYLLLCVSCSSLEIFDSIPEETQYENVPVTWEEKPRNLPSIFIVYHKTSGIKETTEVCKSLGAVLKEPTNRILACAQQVLAVCNVYSEYSEEEMPKEIKEHEDKHCRGYIHD
jgi:hypothetical protein